MIRADDTEALKQGLPWFCTRCWSFSLGPSVSRARVCANPETAFPSLPSSFLFLFRGSFCFRLMSTCFSLYLSLLSSLSLFPSLCLPLFLILCLPLCHSLCFSRCCSSCVCLYLPPPPPPLSSLLPQGRKIPKEPERSPRPRGRRRHAGGGVFGLRGRRHPRRGTGCGRQGNFRQQQARSRGEDSGTEEGLDAHT